MKRTLILLAALFVSAFLSSCIFTGSVEGNGKVTEETRDLGEFDKISVTRGMNVYIMQGSATKVVVRADENLMDVIETTVSDGTLKVSCNRGIRKAESNRVLVTVKLSLTATELNVSAMAGSNVFLGGTADSFKVRANSGSNVKAGELHAASCNLKASSGANIWVQAQKELNASVSSGANVFYYGNPEATNIQKSSGGNVIKN